MFWTLILLLAAIAIVAFGYGSWHSQKQYDEEREMIESVVGENYVIESRKKFMQYSGQKGQYIRYVASKPNEDLTIDSYYVVILDDENNILETQTIFSEIE